MALALGAASIGASGAGPGVLLVGPAGTVGAQYQTIQAAVNAALPGDWVLVARGVYHEKGAPNAGVYITKPGLHLRGMDRNHVIVDGTGPAGSFRDGDPAAPATCSATAAAQDPGPGGIGRNGIEPWKASGVSIDNMTACNFISGTAGGGNEFWWNGGDGSGQTTSMTALGSYLNATSTYYLDSNHGDAEYGIFASNIAPDGTFGQSLWIHTYANNMGDSDYYVGACADCNITIDDAHAENSPLGYSGTNGGGRVLLQNSEWDLNHGGIAPSTLNNDDSPSPEDGACPRGITGPDKADPTKCWVARNNNLHHNNNPNTPAHGIASQLPVGAGIELVATRNDLSVNNNVHDNGAWGIVMFDYPDTETPPAEAVAQGQACRGGTNQIIYSVIAGTPAPACYYPAVGNNTVKNNLYHNGTYGNPTNGDLANQGTQQPFNCFSKNTDRGKPASMWPPTGNGCNPGEGAVLGTELICDAGLLPASCPNAAAKYPHRNKATCGTSQSPGSWQGTKNDGACMMPLAVALSQPTMPNPCSGVPPNAYCNALPPLSTGGVPASVRLPHRGPWDPAPLLAAAAISAAVLILSGPLRRRARRR
jgi:hypothetical protein